MLFTCALVENNQTQCYLIISDTKDKPKLSVAVFILKPLETIKFRASKPKSIIWSDSPSNEFKNKFICIFFFVAIWTKKMFFMFWMEYSATSHVKRVVDEIGVTAKSRIYADVKAKRATVQNAIGFATVAVKVASNITVISAL